MPRGKPKKFEPSVEWLRAEYIQKGRRAADLARELGCNVATLRRRIDEAGLSRRDERAGAIHTSRRAKVDTCRLISLYVDERMPSHKIGPLLGCNTSTVLRALRRAGVAIRHHNDTKRGAPARNRVTVDEKAVIKAYRRDGETMATVAAQFKVTPSVIARVLAEAGEPAKPSNPEGKYAGDKNPRWRADLTAEERATRRDAYKQAKWRARVYERDAYTCMCCGDARGGNLHAHHIEAHARNKAARWQIENGITLCEGCHRAYHRAVKQAQVGRATLEQFISERRLHAAA